MAVEESDVFECPSFLGGNVDSDTNCLDVSSRHNAGT
jgi:hypothetical protein